MTGTFRNAGMGKKQLLVSLFFLSLVVLDWIAGGAHGWYLFAALAGCLVVIAVSVQNIRLDRRREKCITLLRARPDSDPAQEYAAIEKMSGTDHREITRVWNAMQILGVPPEKLKCSDRIDGELREVCGHPDCDIFDGFPLGVLKPRGKSRIREVGTWGELVAEFIRVEKESGAVYTAKS
jgi:hypothetical protein